MANTIFKNDKHQTFFEREGYVNFPVLSPTDVEKLRALYYDLVIPDKYKTGLHVTLAYAEEEQRRRMHQGIMEVISPLLNAHLADRSVIIASYLTKTKQDSGVVSGHQDFTMCDEEKETSIFAWITLQDVNEKDGALGFIPKSHQFFDYKRAFPFPEAQTPVEVHKRKLTAYTRTVPMKSGEIVFFNTKTIHGSFVNQSGKDRLAINLSLRPSHQEQIVYFLKPNGKQDTILKYKIDDEFFFKYTGLEMYQLYRMGKTIPDYPVLAEEPYSFGSIDWKGMKKILLDSGATKDERKEQEVRTFYQLDPTETF